MLVADLPPVGGRLTARAFWVTAVILGAVCLLPNERLGGALYPAARPAVRVPNPPFPPRHPSPLNAQPVPLWPRLTGALRAHRTPHTHQALPDPAIVSDAPLVRTDARGAEFQKWASRAGIVASKVTLASFAGLDGVMATDDIGDGELIIAIPRRLLITTPESPEPNPFPDIADEYWQRAPYSTRLALKLLAERRKGPESQFAEYVGVLPPAFSTPLFWPAAERELLQYPPIQEALASQEREWRARFKALQASSPKAGHSWEDFVWALSNVYSRSYRGEFPTLLAGDQKVDHCLLPWIDMINSRSTTPTRITYNIFLQRLELRAGEEFPRGQQVWLSYAKTNDDLLLYYGYMERDNPGDAYCMAASVERLLGIVPAVPEAVGRQRLTLIRQVGLGPYLDGVCVTAEAPYLRSAQALRMLFTPEGQDPIAAKDRAVKGVERAVFQALAELSRQEIAAWPTTLAEDEAEGATAAPGPQQVALAYRVEKKRVLTKFYAAVSRLL